MLDRVLTRLFDEALSGLGLRVNQLTMLCLLASMDGLRGCDVRELLEMDKSTASRGLAGLRRRGWVNEAPADSRRGKCLTLTPEGRDLLHAALPRWRAAQVEARALLGDESVDGLLGSAEAFLARRARR